MIELTEAVLVAKLKEIKGACEALKGRLQAILTFYDGLERNIVASMKESNLPLNRIVSFQRELRKYQDKVKGWLKDIEEGL